MARQPEDWVQDLLELKSDADNARRTYYLRWNEAWKIYNNEYDFSTKANWQSRNFVPRVSLTVEMAAALVRRAMLDAKQWFKLEGLTATAKRYAPYLEKMLAYYLELDKFIDKFTPALKGALVGSILVAKPHLSPFESVEEEYDEEGNLVRREFKQGKGITVSFPDPFNIWLDPTGRGMFVIEDEELDFASAMDLADMGVLDGSVLRKIQEDWAEVDRKYEEQRRRQLLATGSKPSFRRMVKLTHFWGSLPTREGRWAIKNGHFVVANDKYLVRAPMENPYSHGKIPYVVGSPFRRPFSVYHKGLIEDVIGLQRAMTELLNLTLDSTLFSGIKVFEIDLDQIEDPQQILSGIYPGKVFTARKGGQNTQMVRDVQFQGVSRDLVAIYNMCSVEYQNATAVTEFISGAMSTSPGRTATEVVAKQQQGMGIFGEMARNLERSFLEPTLEQLAYLVLDYHENWLSDETLEVLGEQAVLDLMALDPQSIRRRLDPSKIKFRASGVSALLSRTEEIQKIMSLLQAMGQFGPGLNFIMQKIDVPHFFRELFRRLVRAYGWDEADLIREMEETSAPPPADTGGAPTSSPPGPQPGQPAPPSLLQVPTQMEAIRQVVSGGGVAPSPYGGK